MKPKDNVHLSYDNKVIAFNVGYDTKDSYSISTFYYHNIETDEIKHTHTVIKNWSYNEVPNTGKIEGKKYRENLFTGSLKECYSFIENIVNTQGYWIQNPDKSFEKIFVNKVVS